MFFHRASSRCTYAPSSRHRPRCRGLKRASTRRFEHSGARALLGRQGHQHVRVPGAVEPEGFILVPVAIPDVQA